MVQLARAPRVEAYMAVEFILHYMVVNYGNPILKLDRLNPMSMMAWSIWGFRPLNQSVLTLDIGLTASGDTTMMVKWWGNDPHLHSQLKESI